MLEYNEDLNLSQDISEENIKFYEEREVLWHFTIIS
jgi:hypothetical protein